MSCSGGGSFSSGGGLSATSGAGWAQMSADSGDLVPYGRNATFVNDLNAGVYIAGQKMNYNRDPSGFDCTTGGCLEIVKNSVMDQEDYHKPGHYSAFSTLESCIMACPTDLRNPATYNDQKARDAIQNTLCPSPSSSSFSSSSMSLKSKNVFTNNTNVQKKNIPIAYFL